MALVVQGLTCGYAGQSVVCDASFSLEPGNTLCVLGPNGVGKTTLFKTLLGFIGPIGGTVSIDGRDLRSMARADIAKAVAYVPQRVNLPFSYTVADAVLMGRAPHLRLLQQPGSADREIAAAALDRMGIAHLAQKAVSEVSGGELQLACIARALAQQACYMVMDEPCASLDFGNQARVVELVRSLADQGMGVVMTTHDPEHAFELGSQVVFLRRGAPCISGPCERVLTEDVLGQGYGVRVYLGRIERDGDSHTCCIARAG